jgi:hypothetical protein
VPLAERSGMCSGVLVYFEDASRCNDFEQELQAQFMDKYGITDSLPGLLWTVLAAGGVTYPIIGGKVEANTTQT